MVFVNLGLTDRKLSTSPKPSQEKNGKFFCKQTCPKIVPIHGMAREVKTGEGRNRIAEGGDRKWPHANGPW